MDDHKAEAVGGTASEPYIDIAADLSATLEAAHIKARWPLTYADCFVAVLAKQERATVVTGGPEFRQLESASVVTVAWLAESA